MATLLLASAVAAYHGAGRMPALRMCDSGTASSSTVMPLPVPEHVDYLNDVALTMAPTALSAAVGVLVSRGETLVPPGTDASLHPLLVPLTCDMAGDGAVTGLLRWPAAGGGGSKLPVVRTTGAGRQLEILADCAEHFVAREAVLADAAGAANAAELLRLAELSEFSYSAGDAAASPGGVPGYLITKVGPFVSAYKQLAMRHADGGSEESALITCERTQSCFQAWAHPYAFHSQLLAGFGRHEEARDLARHALGLPLWTLGDIDIAALCGTAQTTPAELAVSLRKKADGKLSEAELRAQNGMENRTPQQIAKDRASYLLDLVVAAPDEYSWESVRAELADLYRQADMASIGTFVSAVGSEA